MSSNAPTPRDARADETPVEVTIVKQPLLAWWAVIPVVALFAALYFYGWPDAQRRATEKQFAVSYFVGTMLGALLIPLALAWIVHRATKRTTFVSTIVFSAATAFVCLSLIKPSLPRQYPASVVTPPAATNQLTRFDAFQFEVPTPWVVGRNEREGTRATLALLNNAGNKWVGLLKVDVDESGEQDPSEAVAHFLTSGGGTSPVTVDGVAGIRFNAPNRGFELPSHGVAAFRDGKMYSILVASEDNVDVLPAFEHVLQTWRWDGSASGMKP